MIKLSRAGWNNVIIFGVLGFILLINATHDNVFESRDVSTEPSIFPEQAVILTLTINQQIVIERIGKSWRITGAQLPDQLLAQMMLSWHEINAEQVQVDDSDNLDPQLGLIVSLELAGQAQPVVLSLLVEQQQLWLYHHGNSAWFSLPLPLYRQLMPEQLFN